MPLQTDPRMNRPAQMCGRVSTWGPQCTLLLMFGSACLGPIGLRLHRSVVLAETPRSENARGARIPGKVICGQVPVDVAPAETEGGLPAGSRIVALDPARPEAGVTNLTASFVAAGRPDVSFDGQRVLFVGRREAADPLSVWEMALDGSSVRQVVAAASDCTAAVHLSTIFAIDHGDPTYQIAFVTRGDDGASAIHTCRLDGTDVTRITFNPYGAAHPCPLSDGRLLFSGARSAGTDTNGGSGTALFTVNTDGTDVAAFATAPEPPAFSGRACETPDGEVVFVESLTAGGLGGGTLVAVPRGNSLHVRRVIREDSEGAFRSPTALLDGRLLVSYRNPTASSWGLVVVDAEGAEPMQRVFDATEWHDIDAVVAVARPEPAGRSSVVDDRSGTGLLYCMDSYLSGLQRGDDGGEDASRRVQVYQAVSQENVKAGPLAERLLGTAKVESDGSFFLEVPVHTPLRLQTVDAQGDVVQAMQSWIWVMPREARGCIGCHEDRRLTPPNRHVLALQKRPKRIGVDAARRFVPADEGPPVPSEPE